LASSQRKAKRKKKSKKKRALKRDLKSTLNGDKISTSDHTFCGNVFAWGNLWRMPGIERWSWIVVHRACLPRYPRHQLWRRPGKIEWIVVSFSTISKWGEKIKTLDQSPINQNFELNKSRQKFHHSLKEHHKISNIPKFRFKML
jgi:hypothetical protein